ncbi:MAG: L,D-transpeptidase, partial [Candidatus Eremiobacterota bacterium]
MVLLATCAAAQPLRPLAGQDQTATSAPGDNLYALARPRRLALEHLAFANRLPVSLEPLKAGTTLVVPGRRILPGSPPADGLVLNLPERGVFLFRDGAFQGFYPVAIGMPGWNTPVGDFKIAVRTVNPTWDPPGWAGGGPPVPPGPANPLGDRWMGLGYRGY